MRFIEEDTRCISSVWNKKIFEIKNKNYVIWTACADLAKLEQNLLPMKKEEFWSKYAASQFLRSFKNKCLKHIKQLFDLKWDDFHAKKIFTISKTLTNCKYNSSRMIKKIHTEFNCLQWFLKKQPTLSMHKFESTILATSIGFNKREKTWIPTENGELTSFLSTLLIHEDVVHHLPIFFFF